MTESEKYIIAQELESLAPVLASIHKPIRKDIPNGYFDRTEDQIMSQIHLLMHDKNKIQVPDGYFETVEDQVLNSITDQQTKVVPIFQKYLFRIAIAASTIFLVAFISYNLFQNDTAVHKDTFADLQVDEAEYFQYLHQNVDELDINMLIDNDLIEESDLSVITYNDILHYEESPTIFETGINF